MKKREVKPFVDVKKKDVIVKLSFLTGLSIKAISEDLCNHAIDSDFAIRLAPHFKRSIKIKKLQFAAQENPLPISKPQVEEIERISLMLSEPIYEYAYSLSYATGISVPKVVAAMIEFSMNDIKFFNDYVSKYLSQKIDPERKKVLQSIMEDINNNFENDYSIAALLFYIADEIKEIDQSIEGSLKEVVSRW